MWGKREFISFSHAGKLGHPVLLSVPGLRCWKWYLWGLCWCGDLPLPWQSVTIGSRSINALGCLPWEPPALSGGTCWRWVTWQRECGSSVTGHNCHIHPEGFPGGLLLTDWFPAASKHSSFPSPVPGGIASESLTFTPLEDMIFLKWEEPVEPNGLITQYEVCPGWCGTQGT